MLVRILSSCTSAKTVDTDAPLSLDDLRNPATRGCHEDGIPARALYAGMQHRRLLRGIETLEARAKTGEVVPALDLRIVSAGFGVVDAGEELPPYEVTFAGMGREELRTWSEELGVPGAVREALAAEADLQLVLLGDDYAAAARLEDVERLGGPTLVFASRALAERLPELPELRAIRLTRQDPRRFSANLIGLKGELAARLLVALADDERLLARLFDESFDVLAHLEGQPKASDPAVDWIIRTPRQPERKRLRYFIPDWDDLVDPDYDFDAEAYSRGRGGWDTEVYAHQLLDRPAYDGLLVSREVVQKSRKKERHLKNLESHGGIHRYLRVPQHFPVMGDCGAFGYAKEDVPPYSVDDVLDYYERLGFNYGVSVDHLVVAAPTPEARQERYDITLENAAAFLREHRARGLAFTPMGAVQGWDVASYREAARQTVAMGYDYLAIGGLVRTRTREVLAILEAVHEVVPGDVDVHAFGLARLEATQELLRLGVTSIDSASPLRKAWLDATHNYWTLSGVTYAAIRVPAPPRKLEGAARARAERLEGAALRAVREVDRDELSVEDALDALEAYHEAARPGKRSKRRHYRRMLEDRPWQACPCAVCRDVGVEVAIFRGNNRNRRRGFHNTYVFYEMLQRGLEGERLRLVRAVDAPQRELFSVRSQLLK